MRSLYLKIFLWFWLAMALVNVALVITVEITRPADPGTPLRPLIRHALHSYALAAAESYERGGQAALASYLDGIERESQMRAVLFNERGEELSGHDVPVGAQGLAERTSDSLRVDFGFLRMIFPRSSALWSQRVRGAGQNSYVLVVETQPSAGPFGANLRSHALRLLIALITGGILCYWLARYVTAPIVRLRCATRDLADGNLKARAGPALVRRRDEIGHLGRDFNVMAERIETLMLAQRRLLGDISHELRSPLARIGVALELVRKRAGSEAASALNRIEHETDELNELINQLLTLTRLETCAEGPNGMKVDLAELVREVAADADFEARSRNSAVHVVACEECATTGIAELLHSAVENVVRNALRYTAEGTQVEISLRCDKGVDHGAAVISVRDHGAGVPEASLQDIFRPFYRVGDARDRQTGGNGLGLAITSRAVRLHGGTVKAANAPDGGLVVEIRLPLACDARKE
jgi:two-component system sensor histidine kinase CpxA